MEKENVTEKPKRGRKKETAESGVVTREPLQDWRSKVNDKHIVLNRAAYAAKGINVDILSEEEVAAEKSRAADNELLITLAGFRELAAVRGVHSVEYQMLSESDVATTVKCRIEWLDNKEGRGKIVEDIATANNETTNKVFFNYKSSIAANRAFCRAVRNSLGIEVVGFEEMKDEDTVKISSQGGKPHNFLSAFLIDKGITFEQMQKYIQEGIDGAVPPIKWENWSKAEDIPPALCIAIKGFLHENLKSQEKPKIPF